MQLKSIKKNKVQQKKKEKQRNRNKKKVKNSRKELEKIKKIYSIIAKQHGKFQNSTSTKIFKNNDNEVKKKSYY